MLDGQYIARNLCIFVLQTWMMPKSMWLDEESCAVTSPSAWLNRTKKSYRFKLKVAISGDFNIIEANIMIFLFSFI